MNCDTAREQMLIADDTELRANELSELGRHLANCVECRRSAAIVVRGTPALVAVVRRRARSARRRRIAWVAGVPIAAAVVVALTLRSRSADSVAPGSFADRQPAAQHVSIDIAPGQHATVLKTADPKVTLIWFSPGASE